METLVITASAGAFSGLTEALAEMAVRVLERPLLSFEPVADWSRLDEALRHRSRYGSLALTSPRAATAVSERVRICGITWGAGPSPRVWAVGAATAAALQGRLGAVQGAFPESSAEESPGLKLAREMLSAGAGGPVLFPCGDKRRDELPDLLRAEGLEVDEVVCYCTVLATPDQARAAIRDATMVLAASPTVVELLVRSCPPSERPALIALGPTSAAAARATGWEPAAVPRAPSTPALAAAIAGLLTPR
jgi:uroporphyrinogen-III synthase